jgi:hypothetical protein
VIAVLAVRRVIYKPEQFSIVVGRTLMRKENEKTHKCTQCQENHENMVNTHVESQASIIQQ